MDEAASERLNKELKLPFILKSLNKPATERKITSAERRRQFERQIDNDVPKKNAIVTNLVDIDKSIGVILYA